MKPLVAIAASALAAMTLASVALASPPVAPASTKHTDLVGVVRSSSGAPVSGATVYIYTAQPRHGVGAYCPSCYVDCGKQATTGSDGRFRIRGLSSSLVFQVLVVRDGYDPLLQSWIDPKARPAEFVLNRITNVSNAAHTLTGRIVESDGTPVVGATVEPIAIFWPGGGEEGQITDKLDALRISDQRGGFRFVCPDTNDSVTVLIKARGLAPMIATGLRPGEASSDPIKMNTGCLISGEIEANGKPVKNAVVEVVQTNLDIAQLYGWFEIASDDTGHFSLPNVPGGHEYAICVRMDSLGNSDLGAPRQKIELKPADTVYDCRTITLQPGVRVAGQVILTDGKPIPDGARLTILRDQTWDAQTIDLRPNGRFSFNDAPPDETIGIDVAVPGYKPTTKDGRGITISTANVPVPFVQVAMKPNNH